MTNDERVALASAIYHCAVWEGPSRLDEEPTAWNLAWMLLEGSAFQKREEPSADEAPSCKMVLDAIRSQVIVPARELLQKYSINPDPRSSRRFTGGQRGVINTLANLETAIEEVAKRVGQGLLFEDGELHPLILRHIASKGPKEQGELVEELNLPEWAARDSLRTWVNEGLLKKPRSKAARLPEWLSAPFASALDAFQDIETQYATA